MSTYYFLICDDHKERTDAASRTVFGLGGPLCDSLTTLAPFIVTHSECNVRIVSEHEYEAFCDEYKEWTEENVREMALMERD